MPPDNNDEAALVQLDKLTAMLTELPDNSADTCISLRPCLPPPHDMPGPHPDREQVIRLMSEIDRVLRPLGTLWLCHSTFDGLETVIPETWRAALQTVLIVPDRIGRGPDEAPPHWPVQITEHLFVLRRGKGGRYDRHIYFDSLRAGASRYDGPHWGRDTDVWCSGPDLCVHQVVSVERLARACILSSTRSGGMVLDLAGESDAVYDAAGDVGRSYVGVSAFTEPQAADGSNSRIVLGL